MVAVELKVLPSNSNSGGGGGLEILMRKSEELLHFPLRNQRRRSKHEITYSPALHQRIHPLARITIQQIIHHHHHHYHHNHPTNYKITLSTSFIQANTSLQTSISEKRSERNGRDTDIQPQSILLLLLYKRELQGEKESFF